MRGSLAELRHGAAALLLAAGVSDTVAMRVRDTPTRGSWPGISVTQVSPDEDR